MSTTERRIMQITPASGWWARLNNPDGLGVVYVALSCWALVEETVVPERRHSSERKVVGMTAEGDSVYFVDTQKGFETYVSPEDYYRLTDEKEGQ